MDEMIPLTERQKNISSYLLKLQAPVGVDKLSKIFTISKRSVYYDLKKIELWANESGFTFRRLSGKGIMISAPGKIKSNGLPNVYLSPENRRKYLLLKLLLSEDFQSAHELAGDLSVSRSTILSDIREIRKTLRQKAISLKGITSHGYIILGEEIKIRSFLTQLIISSFSTYELISMIIKEQEMSQLEPNLRFIVTNLQFSLIKSSVKDASNQLKFWLPDVDYVRFIIYQAICVKRIQLEKRIRKTVSGSRKLTTFEEYQIARNINFNLQSRLNIEIDEPEIINTAKMLLTCNIKISEDNQNAGHFDNSLQVTVDAMIQAILPMAALDSEACSKLRKDLIDHLKLTIKQIQFGVMTENELLQRIKINYPKSYQLAERMAAVFTDYMEMVLPESEIGYIALHIAVYLEVANQGGGNLRAIVICNSGKGAANILSKKLNIHVPELLIEGTYSVFDVEEDHELLTNIDLIISTINYVNNAKPVLKISPLLSDYELSLIKTFILNEGFSINNIDVHLTESVFSTVYQRLEERVDPEVIRVLKEELSNVEFMVSDRLMQSSKTEEAGQADSELTAMVVLEAIRLIKEIQRNKYSLSDDASVGLILHLIMCTDRWKRGLFSKEPDLKTYIQDYPKLFDLISEFLEKAEGFLGQPIPEGEAVAILRYII